MPPRSDDPLDDPARQRRASYPYWLHEHASRRSRCLTLSVRALLERWRLTTPELEEAPA